MARERVIPLGMTHWEHKKRENIEQIKRFRTILLDRGLSLRGWYEANKERLEAMGITLNMCKDVANGRISGLRGKGMIAREALIAEFGDFFREREETEK